MIYTPCHDHQPRRTRRHWQPLGEGMYLGSLATSDQWYMTSYGIAHYTATGRCDLEHTVCRAVQHKKIEGPLDVITNYICPKCGGRVELSCGCYYCRSLECYYATNAIPPYKLRADSEKT